MYQQCWCTRPYLHSGAFQRLRQVCMGPRLSGFCMSQHDPCHFDKWPPQDNNWSITSFTGNYRWLNFINGSLSTSSPIISSSYCPASFAALGLTHTAVDRPLRAQLDALRFQFPLFRMWQNILKNQTFSSTLQHFQFPQLAETSMLCRVSISQLGF